MSDGTEARPAFTHKGERHGLVGPFTGRQIVAALGFVVVVALVGVGVTIPLGSTAPAGAADPATIQYRVGAPVEGLRVGDRPPDLRVIGPDGSSQPLLDVHGQPVDLAALRGRPVWINFWASWCPPCQAETPVLRELANRYRDRGLAVIGISVQETSVADVRAYADRYGLGYTIAADLRGDVFRAWRIYGLPTQFFLDADGVIRAVVQGPVTLESAAQQIEALLPPKK